MHMLSKSLLLGICLLAPLSVRAADAPGEQPGPSSQAQAPAPAKTAAPSTARSDAAEARYRAWVEQEHAKDSVEFSKEKNKIEDKYKGYVRPKHDKKTVKPDAAPAKQ